MKLKVNGKDENIEKSSVSVIDLLQIFNVEQPDMVSVQLNGEFVNRDNFKATKVNENDEVDFLYFMGGGQ